MSTDECIICLNPKKLIKNTDVIFFSKTLNVNFLFKCMCVMTCHRKCMTNWIEVNPTCPYCRKYLTILWTPATYIQWNGKLLFERIFNHGSARILVVFVYFFIFTYFIQLRVNDAIRNNTGEII